jgi:hypothetical protein
MTSSCGDQVFKVKEFTSEELMWFKPFDRKADTAIFISEKGELDTIIFNKTVIDSSETRNFEQGYYDKKNLTVSYDFTKGSYHQFAKSDDGESRFNQNLCHISRTSSTDYSDFEVIFIGIIYNGNELKNIQKIDENTYFFDSKKATYPSINVEKEIKDFTFNTEKGIVFYTDDRGLKWRRNKW